VSQTQTNDSKTGTVDSSNPSARVLLINGSPSKTSKTGVILGIFAEQLKEKGAGVELVSVLDFQAEDLLLGNFESPKVKDFVGKIASAQIIVIATPVYKASYTGVLKALLDLVPPGAFVDKAVLPLATAGALAHFLALDYALKPVLSYLGTGRFLSNLFFTDKQLTYQEGKLVFDEEGDTRFKNGLQEIIRELEKRGLELREWKEK
jgi:FMN reductase